MAAKKKSKAPAAKKTSKRTLFTFTGDDGVEYSLTLREKLFCEKYLEQGANGVQAIFAAGYNVKSALTAKSMAYENLTKPHIYQYVNKLLVDYGFTDDNVEKQHLFLINQSGDLKSKAKGVDMFYKIRGTYAPTKHEVYDPYEEVTDEQIIAELARRRDHRKPPSEH